MVVVMEQPKTFGQRLKAGLLAIGKWIGLRVAWFIASIFWLLKPLRHPYGFYPSGLQKFLKSWNGQMLRMFVFSFGRRAYIDQPCTIKDPESFVPKVDTEEHLRLSEEDIRSFYERGYLGPFTLCSREEMIEIREEISKAMDTPSAIYGFVTGRDRHLDCECLYQLIKRPELTERLAQILGPNLLLWRSQVFLKPPGAPEVTWHQASTYLMERIFRPALYPQDINQLFQLTTWLAFDDVKLENGALQFATGSHKKINTMRIGGSKAASFSRAKISLEYDIDPDKLATMEMQAGQFVIFTERVVHGSPPNRSDRRRWGMAFRTIRPDVQVYDKDEKVHRVAYLGENYPLDKWGTIVLRGVDTAGVNRGLDPFPELAKAQHEPALSPK